MATIQRTLLFTLALGISHASMIPYSIQQTVTVAPAGQHLEFASAFTVAQFDPALGILNSIDVRLSLSGLLSWQTILRPADGSSGPGFTDVFQPSDYTFLGGSWHDDDGVIYANGGEACGIPTPDYRAQFPYPSSCSPTYAHLSGMAGLILRGTIGDGFSTFPAPSSGSSPNDLAPYYGTSTVDLPITFSLDGRGSGYNGIVVGNFNGPQTVSIGLGWNYNYTQTPIVAPLTATPEPRLIWLLIGVAVVAGWRVKRHAVAE